MKNSKEKSILAGLALAFAVLVFVELLLIGSAKEQKQTAAWVAQTHAILEKLDDLVTYLSDAENGRRGYVLSGHDRYLGHHTNRLGHVARTLRELRELTKDNVRQSAACDQLEELIRRRLTISTNSIKARRENGLDVPAQTSFMEQGQQAMDPIRRLAAEMTAEERRTLQERQAIQNKNVEGTLGFGVLVSILGLGLFAVLFVLFSRANRQRRRAEDVLQQTNLELEQRVQQRTAELSHTVQKLEHAVAELKRMERALRESEQHLRLIIETALDGVITIDAGGTITGWNPQAEKMFGWSGQEVMGKRLAETIIPARHREAHERGLKHFAASGEGPVLNKRIELSALNRNGAEFPVELAITPLRSGSAVSFSAFVRDITARKQGEEALARERNLLRTLIDNLPAYIFLKDSAGRYVVNNLANVRSIQADSEAETLGKTVFDFFPEDIARIYDAHDRQVLATGQTLVEREVPVRRKDGKEGWLLTTKLPLRDSQGAITGLLGISQDITERKRAQEQAAWLASFPERNPNPIIELDIESGVVHYVNPFAARLFPDLHNQGFRHPWLAGLQEAAKPLLEGRTDTLRRELAVGEFYYAQTIHYIPEAHRLRIYSSDITQRKAAEEALARERNLLRLLIDNLPSCIYVKDQQGKFLVFNAASVRLVGASSEAEALGKTVFDFFPPEMARLYEADDRRLLATSQAILDREEPTQDREGKRRWFLTTKIPLSDSNDATIGLLGISHDITERKEAEQKLQAQLARLDLLSRTTRAIGERQDLQSIFQVVLGSLEKHLAIDFGCVCFYDATREVLIVNRVGIKSEPLALELALPEGVEIDIDQNGLSRCVRGQLVYEPDSAQVQFPFPQRFGRAGLRSLVIAPLLVESRVFGVLVAARRPPHSFNSGECEFLRQLSEHVALAAHQAQIHSALQQAYDDLGQTQQAVMQQERLRALGQMASGIAHDINNAISPVALYTDTLLQHEPNLSARTRAYLETIERAIDDVAATVTRIREFYRAREPELTSEPVHLNMLVQQVIELTRARWSDIPQQRGIVIKVQTDFATEVPAVLGAESEIREALTNLIFNAVDAMPNGGTLTLQTKHAQGAPGSHEATAQRHVQVEVADTGIGMDEDTRRRCLEPFFTTKGERGTGLGLAMVYGIVQRHSAKIEIESAVNKGTIVRLSFPVPATDVAGRSRSEGGDTFPAHLRILVVDDDPVLLRALRDTLETDGHVVATAGHGQAGIDAFHAAQQRGEAFAVVITDLGMPYVDGRAVASAVKAASPLTPVIMLTGWGKRMVAEGNVPTHVDRVLSKPPKLRELREAFADCCQRAGVESTRMQNEKDADA